MRIYLPYYAIISEAGRIALTTCSICGATIVLGMEDQSAAELHSRWHATPAPTEPKP